MAWGGSAKRQKNSSTTTLPSSLREELGLDGEDSRGKARASGFRNSAPRTRKDIRKAKREQLKDSRRQHSKRNHFETKRSLRDDTERARDAVNGDQSHTRNAKTRDQPLNKSKDRAKILVSSTKKQEKKVPENKATPLQRILESSNSKEELSSPHKSKLKSQAGLKTSSALTSVEQNEEDEIAWLEAKLGMSENGKNKKKRKKIDEESDMEDAIGQMDDGLDDLLIDLDRFHPGMYEETDSEEEREGDRTEDSEVNSEEESEESEEESEEESDENSEEDSEEEIGSSMTEDNLKIPSYGKLEWEDNVDATAPSHSNSEDTEAETNDMIKRSSPVLSAPESQIDSSKRYVPPALRNKMNSSANVAASEEELKIRRQLKGLLNRLGDNNVEMILGEVESAYRQFSRAKVTETMTDLVLGTIRQGDNVTDTFVTTYATLVAALHRVIGVEFGAHFVQHLVEEWKKLFESAYSDGNESTEPVGRACVNLIALFGSLYNVGVMACPLVYDVIKLVLGIDDGKGSAERRNITELDIDHLVRIVKLCGQQLRHDDNTSLRSIAHLANERMSNTASTRAKFMLESLQDLSNNRSRTTAASMSQEQLAKMRKFLAGLAKRRTLRTQEPLRVNLNDLLSAEKRGKWWLVGAAWAGYDFAEQSKHDQDETKKNTRHKNDKGQTEHLYAIAKEHGMNTAVRQQIFVVLLSSEDYLDAVQRLLVLTHQKTSQRREIIRVLLHCLSQEPTFNPYYVIVGGRLAEEDPVGTRITMQYCLWDYLRALGERNVGGKSILDRNAEDEDDALEDDLVVSSKDRMTIANVARCFAWWMAKSDLGLEVLRAIDFTSLKRRGIRFVQMLLLCLLLGVQATSPAQVFSLGTSSLTTSSKTTIETIFVQGTKANQRVAQGLLVFFKSHLRKQDCVQYAKELGLDTQTTQYVLTASSVAVETLRVGTAMAIQRREDSNEL